MFPEMEISTTKSLRMLLSSMLLQEGMNKQKSAKFEG